MQRLIEAVAAEPPGARWVVLTLDTAADAASGRVALRESNSGIYDRMETDERLAVLEAEDAIRPAILRAASEFGASVVWVGSGSPGALARHAATKLRQVVETDAEIGGGTS